MGRKYIYIALIYIIIAWLLDTILDVFYFYKEDFLDLLILNIPPHEIYTRIMFSLFIIIITYINYRNLKKTKKINSDLIYNNRKLQITLDSIGDAVIVTDANKKIVTMNPIAENLTGWKLNEALGKNLQDVFNIINSITRERVEDPAEKVIRTGRIVGLANHTALISKSGEEFQIADSGSPIIDDDGNLIGVVLIFRDVSLIYQKDKELQEYKSFLEAIFNSIQDGISVLNPDLTVRMTNKVMNEWYKDNLPLEGKKCYECYHNSNEPCDPCPTIRTLQSKKTEFDIVPGLPGSRIEWLELYCYPIFDEQQNVTGVVEFVRDVTDRVKLNKALKLSEKNYREMVEFLPVGVYRTTEDGEIIYANNKLIELLGYKDFNDFKNSGNILNSYFNSKRREEFIDELLKKGNLEKFEIVLKKKNGQKIIVNENSRVVKDSEGNIQYFEGTIEDITIRKQFEKEMLILSKMESVSILAGGIAHNFNNILTSMSLNLGLAKLNPDKYLEYLDRLEKEIDEATSLSNKFLSFTKTGAIDRQPVNIKELIEDVEKMALSGSGCVTHKEIDENIWRLFVDKKQINEVLMNLFINAKQAMANEGTITIKVNNYVENDGQTGLQNGKYLKIQIQDEGIGIPQKYLDRIFEPFFTTKEDGNGLGLASVHYIVQKHGGKVNVSSELGKGTTFEVFLPATEENVKEEMQIQSSEKLSQNLNILFMDDEEDIRDNVEEISEILNLNIETVENGEQAIEKYRQSITNNSKYDIVILDLTVKGGMGGERAIKELLKVDPEVKAIVFSGHSTTPIAEDYKKYGFKGRMTKPITIDGFINVINQVMES